MKSNLEKFIQFLIIYSVSMYMIEMVSGTRNSLEGSAFFLWSERVVAIVFTIELFWRINIANRKNELFSYFLSPICLIDVVSILPFWIGFGLPSGLLGIVRTLRILRLLKFFRYSRGLQLVALGFYRAGAQLKFLVFPVVVAVLFSTVAMYEAEHLTQPEKFDSLFNSFWFIAVTVTTVGYGDISPITVLGKVIAMITFISVLSLFAGFIGVVGSAMSKVLDEEADPNIDPIDLFHVEKQKRRSLKQRSN